MSTLTSGLADYGCKKRDCYYCGCLKGNQSSYKLLIVLNMDNTYLVNSELTEVITVKSKV